MPSLICGRCGNRTAPSSTYCSHCRWTLPTSQIIPDSADVTVNLNFPLPRVGGFRSRRRLDHQIKQLEDHIRSLVDPRVDKLEEELQADPANPRCHRELGVLMLVERHWERANAHLQRAHQLAPDDYETHLNLGIVLAQRGQIQPALELLQEAREKWPEHPAVYLNIALVALQGRRAQVAIDAISELDTLAEANLAISEQFHSDAMTVRGLAYLLLNQHGKAREALDAALHHTTRLGQMAVLHDETEKTDHDTLSDAGSEAEGEGDDLPAPEVDPDLTQTTESMQHVLNADLLNNLALAEAAMGEMESAAVHLQAALQTEPGHTPVLNNLGVLAYQTGQFNPARRFLEVARQIEESVGSPEPATYNHLGVVLSATGKLAESLEHFQKAGQQERAEFEVFFNLGRAYIEHGHPERGVEQLRHAFRLNPNQPDLHAVLGAAYLLRGKPHLLNEGVKHLRHALSLRAGHRVAQVDLAMGLMELLQKDDALRMLSRALKENPKNTEALFLLAMLIMERGDDESWASAAMQFNNVLLARPDLLASQFNAALCQYLCGFRDSAAVQLQRICERDPSFAPAYYMMGVGHAQGKRWKEALQAWQMAVKYEPGRADVLANIGYVYFQQENFEQAIKFYVQAHQKDPGDYEILSGMGICFARAKKINQALHSFEQSLKINPRSPVTHSNIGLAFYLNRNVERAMEHWRTVSQLDSRYASKREEEQQKAFDESPVQMRPINWRYRIIRLAPVLPHPHTRLQPGYNLRAFRPALIDPEVQHLYFLVGELRRMARRLAAMNARH